MWGEKGTKRASAYLIQEGQVDGFTFHHLSRLTAMSRHSRDAQPGQEPFRRLCLQASSWSSSSDRIAGDRR